MFRLEVLGVAAIVVGVACSGSGRARGERVLIAVRDTGSFMDPRSRKDWW